MKTHKLKLMTEFYLPVIEGKKRAEVRKNDRDYNAGDFLELNEWDGDQYTGLSCTVRVTHILPGGEFGIDKDYVVMSFTLC